MAPRTRRAANQENAVKSAAPPTPLAKPNPKGKEKRPSRVLQDITSQFVDPDSNAAAESPVRPRLKRKAKSPTRESAKKRRTTNKGKGRHPAIPSSLPPSSPPSVSSRFEVLNADDETIAAGQPSTSVPGKQVSVYGDENQDPLHDDFNPFHDQPLSFHTEDFAPGQTDPFGFFAVESKLKAQRATNPPSEGPHLYTEGVERILSDIDVPVDDDHPTPHPDTVEEVNDENAPPTPPMPSTPHKRRKHISSASPPNVPFGGRLESVPSTPSPSKRRSSRTHAAQNIEEESDSELVLPKISKAAHSGVKRSIKGEKPSSRKKARIEDESLTPRTLAANLQSLLPKRSSRLRQKGKGKARAQDDSGDETETATKRTKKRATAKKPRSKPSKGQSAAAAEDEDEIDVDERKEKLEAERRARLEYFKKLDSYKVEEENVYVI